MVGFAANPLGPVAAGVPVSIEIAALADGGAPYAEFVGEVSLAVSTGRIEPGTIELLDGKAVGQFTLHDTWGADVRLVLNGSGVRSESTLPTVHLAEIPGDGGAVADDMIPEFELDPQPEEYPANHPELSGMPASQSILVLSFAKGTTTEEANDLLTSIGAWIAGATDNVVCLRLTDTGARTPTDLDAMMAELRSDPRVASVAQDVLLGSTVITDPNGGNPGDWSWETTPGTGNWGLERIRVPSLWNLNDVARKAGRSVRTGVLDVGFTAGGHPDLDYDTIGDIVEDNHGMHVAGIIGGTFDNALGIDGVNPFSDLVVHGIGIDTDSQWRVSFGQVLTGGLQRLLAYSPSVRVFNVSLGYNWYRAGIDPSTSAYAQQIASQHGAILAGNLEQWSQSASLPLIVAAAGNEAGPTVPGAAWSSPLTNASIEHGVTEILVIENVDDSPGTGTGDVTRAVTSCSGGDLSAPGEGIRSTFRSGYGTLSGTSMAAPHVAGLVGYLLSLDPSLSNEQLIDLLLDTAETAGGGAADRVDAWAAAVEIDELRQNDAILTALVDIDDGSEDGNLREEYPSGTPIVQNDFDGDGGLGDGRVDMSDFRRWRDWVLYAEENPGQLLDGPSTGEKLDQNGDGLVGSGPDERMYSRGDFNGDGLISTSAKSYYPGRIDAEVTDLEVLQRVFSDPDYQASDLPSLLRSGEFHIDGSALLDVPGAATARVVIRRRSDNVVVAEKDFGPADPSYLVTVALDPVGFELEAEARDGGFVQLEEHVMTTQLLECEDVYWKPSSAPVLFVELSAPGVAVVETGFPVSVRAGLQSSDGTRTYESGITISLQANGATFSSSSGTTDSDGVFVVEGELDPTTEVTTIFATAARTGFDPVTAQAQVLAISNLPRVFVRSADFHAQASTRVELEGSGDHPASYALDQKEESDDTVLSWSRSLSSSSTGNTNYANQDISGDASATGSITADVYTVDSRVYRWAGQASSSASSVGTNTGSFGFRTVESIGSGQSRTRLIVQSRTRVTGAVTTLSASGVGRASFSLLGPQGFRIYYETDGSGSPPAIDVILEPGEYSFVVNATVGGSIDRFCGCSQRIGSGAVSWDLSFSQP